MREKIFRNKDKSISEKYKYCSAIYHEIYFSKQDNLIKNYVMEPFAKLVK